MQMRAEVTTSSCEGEKDEYNHLALPRAPAEMKIFLVFPEK